jgi:hypothetical protein
MAVPVVEVEVIPIQPQVEQAIHRQLAQVKEIMVAQVKMYLGQVLGAEAVVELELQVQPELLQETAGMGQPLQLLGHQ